MSRMQCVDISPLHQTTTQRTDTPVGLCKQSSVLDAGKHRPWPFLFSYKESGSVEINRGTKKTAYQQAQEIGEALL